MRERIIAALGVEKFAFLVPEFPVLLVIALFLGCFLTLREAGKQGLCDEHRYQAVFLALLFVLPGARIVFALQYPEHYSRLWDLLSLDGGLALYGGLLGVLLPPSVYLWREGVKPGRFLDGVTPALALGIFVGRIGCFLAGCNFGKVTDVPWAVCFPGPKHAYAQHLERGLIDSSATLSLPVHPTQLYESAFGLLMLIPIFYWLRRDHLPGTIFWKAIAAYAVFRFFVEFLRADSAGISFGPFTFAQVLSIGLLSGSLLLLLCPRRNRLAEERIETA